MGLNPCRFDPGSGHFNYTMKTKTTKLIPSIILIILFFTWIYNTKNNHQESSEINDLIKLISKKYVDSISEEQLKQIIIEKALLELDPHSSLIPKQELSLVNESMQGHFSGIGVSFRIINDTICIISVIENGPSMHEGILAGDKIIKVNDQNFNGSFLSNDTVMKTLKGSSGSNISVQIKRPEHDSLLLFNIKRGHVDMSSIDAAFDIDSIYSYIKINRFTSNSYEEFIQNVKKLNLTQNQVLILDLRSNPGGVLGDCYEIAEEFFKKGELIFYTKTRNKITRKFKSRKNGTLQKNKILVLVNENSASASEIIAGAIQDNDRGLIIGRRTFGKGLVQEQFELNDGSALRLTTQKYFTPSGRLIQKPYKGFSPEQENILSKIVNGEIINTDSIDFIDSVKFKTKKGRIVYGGGGIFPDVFVSEDTLDIIDIERSEIYSDILKIHIQSYILSHFNIKEIKSQFNINSFAIKFELIEKDIKNLEKYYNRLKTKEYIFFNEKEEIFFKKYIKTRISEMIWGDNGLYRSMIEDDLYIKKIKQIN